MGPLWRLHQYALYGHKRRSFKDICDLVRPVRHLPGPNWTGRPVLQVESGLVRSAPLGQRGAYQEERVLAGGVLQSDGGRHVLQGIRRTGLRGAAGRERIGRAAARRDALWARPSGNDTRTADSGSAIRGLPGRVPAPGRPESAGRRAAGFSGGDMGDVRAVLPVDFPGRTAH